jgi:hypothetical protein
MSLASSAYPSGFTLTYNSLRDQILVYANRSDDEFLSEVPIFTLLAQQRINRDYKGLAGEGYVTGVFSVGQPGLVRPFTH